MPAPAAAWRRQGGVGQGPPVNLQKEPGSDVAVVGAGYAGLSAAVGLRRHRLSVRVFDGGPVRNALSAEVHGYLGVAGESASQVMERSRRHAADLGARLEQCRISQARRDGEGFVLTDVDGGSWRARRLLLATGVRDRLPDIPGIRDYFGRSIHVCPHCDAYEWRDRPIAVISWSGATRDFAVKVSHWSDRVTVVTDGRTPRIDDKEAADLRDHGIGLVTADISSLEGRDGQLSGLHFADGGRLEVDAAFVHLGEDYNTELADQLGCRLTDDGAIEVDEDMHTSEEGIWAAGDVAGDSQFVPVAVAHGVKAAVAIYRTLAPTDPDAGPP
jgi:thioredoxin reductase